MSDARTETDVLTGNAETDILGLSECDRCMPRNCEQNSPRVEIMMIRMATFQEVYSPTSASPEHCAVSKTDYNVPGLASRVPPDPSSIMRFQASSLDQNLSCVHPAASLQGRPSNSCFIAMAGVVCIAWLTVVGGDSCHLWFHFGASPELQLQARHCREDVRLT